MGKIPMHIQVYVRTLVAISRDVGQEGAAAYELLSG
jgi:hypothetical protein